MQTYPISFLRVGIFLVAAYAVLLAISGLTSFSVFIPADPAEIPTTARNQMILAAFQPALYLGFAYLLVRNARRIADRMADVDSKSHSPIDLSLASAIQLLGVFIAIERVGNPIQTLAFYFLDVQRGPASFFFFQVLGSVVVVIASCTLIFFPNWYVKVLSRFAGMSA